MMTCRTTWCCGTLALVVLMMCAAVDVVAQNLEWAKRAGGTSEGLGLDITTNSAGNSYITGNFHGTATFGAGEAQETTLTAAGDNDLFVAKYAANGTLVWATRAGGTGDDESLGIAIDNAGNSYVTGNFHGTATFGAGEA